MVDRYTKTILTVIAVCLGIIALKDLRPINSADAQPGQAHVFIDGVASGAFQDAGPIKVTAR